MSLLRDEPPTEADRALIDAATRVRQHAHAPFSGYRVGAAVQTADGAVYTGCNVEISSFSHTCCAERVAVFKAVSDGHRALVAVAVVTDDASPVSPCGACRQVLHDFGPGMRVVLASTGGAVRVRSLAELLPEGFEADRVIRHLRSVHRWEPER